MTSHCCRGPKWPQSVFLSSLALTSNLIKPLVSESQRSLSQLFCPFFSDTLLLPCTQCEEHFCYFSCSQTSHAHFTAGLTLLHGVVSSGLFHIPATGDPVFILNEGLELVMDREAWRAAVHGVTTTELN